MKIWLTEITAYNPATLTEVTLRFCTGRGFITKPTETPANTTYLQRITQPALVRRDIPIPGQSATATRLSYGDMVLSNADGALDYLTSYDFSGRGIIIRSGEDTAAYPGGFSISLVAVVDSIRVGIKEVTVKIKSPRVNLEQPVATATYGGTNTPTSGIDGDISLAGTAKPVVFGYAAPVTPIMVNSNLKIYQYNVPSVVYPVLNTQTLTYMLQVAVAEGGVALVGGAIYQDSAEMQADTPATWGAGIDYRLCPSEGFFRLKQTPTFRMSCRLTPAVGPFNCLAALINGPGGGTPGGSYLAYVMPGYLMYVTRLNTYAGVAIASGKTLTQIMDDIAYPVGLWWGFLKDGSLRIGSYLYGLDQVSAATITLQDIISFERDAAPLFWRVIIRYNHNAAVHSTAEMPSATLETQQTYATKWSEQVCENQSFKTRHPSAGEFVAETALAVSLSSLPVDWPTTLQGPTGSGREILKIACHLDATEMAAVDLGSPVTIIMPRLGYGAGKKFLVCGIQTDAVKNRVDLTLWG
jgi:hypothetical protein